MCWHVPAFHALTPRAEETWRCHRLGKASDHAKSKLEISTPRGFFSNCERLEAFFTHGINKCHHHGVVPLSISESSISHKFCGRTIGRSMQIPQLDHTPPSTKLVGCVPNKITTPSKNMPCKDWLENLKHPHFRFQSPGNNYMANSSPRYICSKVSNRKTSIDLESWRFFMNKKTKTKHDNRPPSHKSPWYEEPHAPSDIGRHGHSYCASKPRDGWLGLFQTTGRYGEMQCLNGDLLIKDMG